MMEGEDLSVEKILSQLSQFSPLEISILYLKCQDKKHEEIGAQLGYASSTISDYVSAIYEKLGFDPQWHWRKRLAYLREHYCQAIADVHDGRVAPRRQPEAEPPPQPAPYWIELVRQEERENQDPWEQVLHPVPPLRTVRARPRFDFFRLLEFIMVAGTCAFVCWLGVNYLLTPISLSLMRASAPTSTSGSLPFPDAAQTPAAALPVTGPTTLPALLSRTAIPTATAALAAPESTVTLPANRVLYANTFDTFPVDILSGKAAIVNGMLVAQEDIQLVVGEDTWRDYSVSFQATPPFCIAEEYGGIRVGMRASSDTHMVEIQLCGNWILFGTVNPHWSTIPYSSMDLQGDCCTVSVQGDIFSYEGRQVTMPGYPQGKVYIQIPAGYAIDNLVIRALP